MKYICAIDMGATQFKFIVASVTEIGEMEILASTKKKVNSVNDGSIIDFQQASETISDCYDEIVNLSGINKKDIEDFFVNITGSQIKGYDGSLNNFISIDHGRKKITYEDIQKVIQSSEAEGLFSDSEIIHKIPRYFSVDSTTMIQNPYGLEGQKLSVNSYIIAANRYQVSNLKNVLNSTGIKNPNFILNAIASSNAVLSDDQKEMGVILIDIGGGNIDVAGYIKGSLLFTFSIKGGGKEITLDLAKDFSLNLDVAERLKHDFEKIVNSGKNVIPVPDIGGMEKELRIPNVKRSISDKFTGIFGNIYNKIQYYLEQDNYVAGIVLTGGASMSYDIVETARIHFSLPVQRGGLENIKIPGMDNIEMVPEYATGIGLLLHHRNDKFNIKKKAPKKKIDIKLFDILKGLFKDLKD